MFEHNTVADSVPDPNSTASSSTPQLPDDYTPTADPTVVDAGDANVNMKSGDEAQTQGKSNKSNNDNLREWLDSFADKYLKEWYDNDGAPSSACCALCTKETKDFHRCTSCAGLGPVCSACITYWHRHLPTHCIQTWDKTSWADDDLSREGLDLVLYLGHAGLSCPSNDKTWNLHVGDLNGFTTIKVRYCTCDEAVHRRRQLLRAGLFPCSHIHPQSAMTFSLMEMYNLLTTVGRTSGHKYYTVLEQFTKPGFPGKVDDRYRELMWTHCRYLHLTQLRLSSCLFPPHPDIDSNPGDQSFDCVACPRPGFNFEWAEVSDEERCWFRLWYSYNGNFCSVRKNKKVDPGDVCCSEDLAYFVMREIYKTWTESIPQPKQDDKPVCDNHKAGNDTSVQWAGNDITGIGAWSCTSHSCIAPHGVVDFFKGERFNYADYALATLLYHLLKRRGGCLPIGITYDVWCHYKTNLFERLKLLPESITVPEDLDLIGAIPKLEGEGVERFWSHINQHSGSTSEQSPGNRADTINNVVRGWNYGKAVQMHITLPARYKLAKKTLKKEKAIYNSLTISFENDELIEQWQDEPIEAVEGPKGVWSSPLMDPELSSGGFHQTVNEERKKESPTAQVPGRRPGATRWISDGIELEHSIRNLNKELKTLGRTLGSRRNDALKAKRLALRDRIEKFLNQREYYMGDVPEPDLDKPRVHMFHGRPHNESNGEGDSEDEGEKDGENEDEDGSEDESEGGGEGGGDGVDLGLPSSYKPDTIEAAGLSSMANLERELRRGMCNESLASVKRLLRSRTKGFEYKRHHVRGRKQTTRAEASFRTQTKQVKDAAWQYLNSYGALKQLGLLEPNTAVYQDLANADLVGLKSHYDAYANRKKGERKPAMSWIWRTRAAPNTEEGDVEGLKTEWFRARERYKRWKEQLVLAKREMVMTIRLFQQYQELWEWKARCTGITAGMRAYACSQGKFYSKLAHQMLVSCRQELYDDTVELKWCSNWLQKNVLGSPIYRPHRAMAGIYRPSNGVRELAAGLEEELFGEGGYQWFLEANAQQFAINSRSRRNGKSIVTHTSRGLPQSDPSSITQLAGTRKESDRLRTSSRAASSKLKRKAAKKKSPCSESTRTPTAVSSTPTLDSTDEDYASPTPTLDSTDNSDNEGDRPEATVGGERKEVDEFESTTDEEHEASSSITNNAFHAHEAQASSSQSSPTFPLTRLRQKGSNSLGHASSVGRSAVVNRMYVDLTLPASVSRRSPTRPGVHKSDKSDIEKE